MTALRLPRGAHGALFCCCIFVILGGCAQHGACTKPDVYERSSNGPPLRVPPDLTPPPEDKSYDVPPAQPVTVEAPPCGHYPPKIASASAKKPAAATTAPAAAPLAAPSALVRKDNWAPRGFLSR